MSRHLCCLHPAVHPRPCAGAAVARHLNLRGLGTRLLASMPHPHLHQVPWWGRFRAWSMVCWTLYFFGVDSTWAWSTLERDLSRDFEDTITCKQAQPPQAHHESVLRNVATCDEDLEEGPWERDEPPRMCRTHEDASARRCRHGETRV